MIRRSDLVGTFRDRAEAWRAEALLFEQHQCMEVASTLRRAAEELEQDIQGWEGELLTVQQAVAESGYSAEHLRRLVREGKLREHLDSGGKSHIRVWRRDLPKKQAPRRPSKRGVNPLAGYDPEEDARDIAQHLAR